MHSTKCLSGFLLFAFAFGVSGCASSQVTFDGTAPNPAADPTTTVVLTSEIKWGPLNPARGEKGPKAGNLWGDRAGSGPSGFLVKFLDGFSSPPHIHNITYRGVVISGLIHNDDPGAKPMWMPTGSFWTQPAGEVHITAAKGSNNMAYIEIQNGPYLVLPPEEAVDNGERPVNVHESNIVWRDATDQRAIATTANGPIVASLWGNPHGGQPSGSLVKLPAGLAGTMRGYGSTLRAVIIQGRVKHQGPSETNVHSMDPGSYFSSTEESAHKVSCDAEQDCIIYVRTEKKGDITD